MNMFDRQIEVIRVSLIGMRKEEETTNVLIRHKNLNTYICLWKNSLIVIGESFRGGEGGQPNVRN